MLPALHDTDFGPRWLKHGYESSLEKSTLHDDRKASNKVLVPAVGRREER